MKTSVRMLTLAMQVVMTTPTPPLTLGQATALVAAVARRASKRAHLFLLQTEVEGISVLLPLQEPKLELELPAAASLAAAVWTMTTAMRTTAAWSRTVISRQAAPLDRVNP